MVSIANKVETKESESMEIVTAMQTKKAHSIKSAAQSIDCSVPFLWGEIRKGNLRAKRIARRVLILDADLVSYLEGKEDWTPTAQNGEKI